LETIYLKVIRLLGVLVFYLFSYKLLIKVV
jgi:hypothetical protein